MTAVLFPPRAAWHDRFLLWIAHISQTWPLGFTATMVGVMECVLNVWQYIKQHDFTAQSIKRRQLWIDQARAAAGAPRVALVTGKYYGALALKFPAKMNFIKPVISLSWLRPTSQEATPVSDTRPPRLSSKLDTAPSSVCQYEFFHAEVTTENKRRTEHPCLSNAHSFLLINCPRHLLTPFCFALLACRSVGKGEEAVAKIEAETGIKGLAEVCALDLSSFESVKQFVREFKSRENVLDVLVNSNVFSSILSWRRNKDEDGTDVLT